MSVSIDRVIWNEFPSEIRGHILSYLDPKHLRKMTLAFKNAITEKDQYHKLVCSSFIGAKELDYLIKKNPNYTFSKEIKFEFQDSEISPEQFLLYIAIQKSGQIFETRFPQLMAINLSHRRYCEADINLFEHLQYAPQLKKLDLSAVQVMSEALKKVSKHCPNLVVLKLRRSTELEKSLELSFEGLTKLQFLTVQGCDDLQNLKLDPKLTSLKKLNMRFCFELKNVSFLENIKNIEKLYFPLCNYIPSNQFNHIASYANTLKKLDLTFCKVNDFALIAKCTQLIYLNLSNSQIKDVSQIDKMSFLQKLYLQGCSIKNCMPITYLDRLKSIGLPKKFDRTVTEIPSSWDKIEKIYIGPLSWKPENYRYFSQCKNLKHITIDSVFDLCCRFINDPKFLNRKKYQFNLSFLHEFKKHQFLKTIIFKLPKDDIDRAEIFKILPQLHSISIGSEEPNKRFPQICENPLFSKKPD